MYEPFLVVAFVTYYAAFSTLASFSLELLLQGHYERSKWLPKHPLLTLVLCYVPLLHIIVLALILLAPGDAASFGEDHD